MTTNAPKIYLSNKELLKEIHRSKLTYSWLLDKKYADYDVIVASISDIESNAVANSTPRVSSNTPDRDVPINEQQNY